MLRQPGCIGRFNRQGLSTGRKGYIITFVTGSTGPCTFTRASSGNAWNASTVLTSYGTDVARFNHDPVTGEALGLLMENFATNLARATNDASNAWWSKWQVTTGDTALGPDGAASLVKVIPNATSNTHVITKSLTLTAGDYWCVSAYVRAAEHSKFILYSRSSSFTHTVEARFDTVAETVISTAVQGDGIVLDKGIEDCGGGLFRIWLAGRTNATDTTILWELGALSDSGLRTFTGDGVSGGYMGCFQIEAGTNVDKPTSYIENTGTAFDVSRSGDQLVDGAILTQGWFNPSRGTFVVDFDVPHAGVLNWSRRIFELLKDTNNRLTITYNPTLSNSAIGFNNIIGGVNSSFTLPGSKIAAGVRHRVAVSYNADGTVKGSVDGGAVETLSSSGIGAWTDLRLGCSGSGSFSLGGHVKMSAYYPFDGMNLQQLSGV